MPVTYYALSTVSVSNSGTALIEFLNIPQSYTDLSIRLSARTTRTGTDIDDEIRLEFNNSSALEYDARMVEGQGTGFRTALDLSQARLGRGLAATDNSIAGAFGNSDYYIFNYTSSEKKAILYNSSMDTNSTYSLMNFSSGLWNNSSAITSIKITGLGTFDQYSTATLYGIKNS